MIETQGPNPFQILAWIAGSVLAAIAVVQLPFNVIRERRVRRQDQARFAYELLDDLFDDAAGEVLRKLDRGKWSVERTDDDAKFFEAFRTAFQPGRSSADPAVITARLEFDRALYYFDRVQHAMDAKLVRLDDIRGPLSWYAKLLAENQEGIAGYAERVGYARAALLLASLSTDRPGDDTA